MAENTNKSVAALKNILTILRTNFKFNWNGIYCEFKQTLKTNFKAIVKCQQYIYIYIYVRIYI